MKSQSLLTSAATGRSAPVRWRVAAVQVKFATSLAGNLTKIERAIRTAVRRRADVVLFPECATTGYSCDFAALQPQQVRATLDAVGVLIGSPVPRGRRWQNCLMVFDRTGRVANCYAKCQLTAQDRRFFTPGDGVALFALDGVCCTAITCHERRYPELVRLAVMAGAQVLFHPNAGLDPLAVSRRKRVGRDGIAVRAFENAIFYVFANSVGPQGGGQWSAGDSKIVAPDSRVIALADNASEAVIVADLELAQATRQYARESLAHPRFLAPHWRTPVRAVRRRALQKPSGAAPRGSRRSVRPSMAAFTDGVKTFPPPDVTRPPARESGATRP